MADIAEEYRSSLSELNFNSKPHINMLTMLAEENISHADVIVQAIVDHVNSVTAEIKLPSLYLIDSIVKNIGRTYVSLFSKHLVSLFTSVFEKVDENVRSLLYKLRSTWTNLFPNAVLLQLDRSVVLLDPAWPILAQTSHTNIHVNPKFLDKPTVQVPKEAEPIKTPQSALLQEVEMKKKQLALLLSLQEKKLQLEQLKKKAALAPKVSASIKAETKKPVNSRDPRLSKKTPAVSSDTDSTGLQSVVVIPPKGSDSRKATRALSPPPPSKKAKQEEASPKKHTKNKANSVVDENKKLKDHVKTDHSHVPSQTLNTVKNDRGKKRSFVADNADKCYNTLNKSNKKVVLNVESKVDSGGVHFKQMSFDKLDNSSKHFKVESDSHFTPKVSVADESRFWYNQQPVKANVYDKNIRKLEPPPPPPLFLGTEDKDYRILPKKVEDISFNDTSYPKRRYPDNYANNKDCRVFFRDMTVPVVKSFKLDNKDRKVFFVNDRSFAFLDDNVPRELTFEGSPRLVFIEGFPHPIELGFGGHVVKFEIDGKFNFIKFGTPSREVYINDHPYEAQFGGPPFTAVLANDKIYRIRINGPLPQVVVSNTPAFDLYEKFCMKNQEFLRRFDSEPNINRDVSSHVPVSKLDVDMRMNHNGKESSFFNFPLEKMNDIDWKRVHDGNSRTEWSIPKNSFESFKDIKPEFVPHQNYPEGVQWMRPTPVPEIQNAMNPPPLPPKQIINRFPSMVPPTTFGPTFSGGKTPLLQFPPNAPPRAEPPNNMQFPRPIHNPVEYGVLPEMNNMNSSTIRRLSPPPFPPFLPPTTSNNCMTSVLSMQVSAVLSNTTVSAPMPQTSAPLLPLPSLAPATSFPAQVLEPNLTASSQMPRFAIPAPLLEPNLTATSQMPRFAIPGQVPIIPNVQPPQPAPSTAVNMDLFLEKLVAAGLIGKKTETAPPPVSDSQKEEEVKEETPKEEIIPEITFESKSLKGFYTGVISALYRGSQCATCGMRFKEIQSEQYSRHLDWHFRRNRREKDGAKKPFSRRWFYEIKDWVEFKEFEDVDERAPSYFELQANIEEPEEIVPENVSSVPCSECESEKCAVCSEQFQLFWVEEEEEWHLRNAVKHDDQVYHPACYEDFKKANESINTDLDTSIDEFTANVKLEESEYDIKMKVEESDIPMEQEVKLDVPDELEINMELKPELDFEVKEKIKSDSDVKEDDKKIDVVTKPATVLNRDPRRRPRETISNTERGVKELVDVKKEVVLDSDVKKEVALDTDIKKEVALDTDIKKEVALDTDIKKEVDIDSNIEKEVDLDSNIEKEVDLDSNIEKEVDLDSNIEKDIELDSDIRKDAEASDKVSIEMDVEDVSANGEVAKVAINVDKKTDADINKDSEVSVTNGAKDLDNNEKVPEPSHSDATLDETSTEVVSQLVVPQIEIKVEPMDTEPTDEDKNSHEPSKEKSETDTTNVENVSNVTPNKLDQIKDQSHSFSQVENAPNKSEDDLEDIEFNPPTPDPRFQVLPPVSRGTEISNLCCIM